MQGLEWDQNSLYIHTYINTYIHKYIHTYLSNGGQDGAARVGLELLPSHKCCNKLFYISTRSAYQEKKMVNERNNH